jgi:hypothetical protein
MLCDGNRLLDLCARAIIGATETSLTVITRSEEHDIDRAGQLLLRQAAADLGWIIDFVASDDYGIDCNVQVFEGKFPSGVWFHVQLKSSNSSAYSSDGAFISQELSVSHARHYALKLRQSIFLIHADVREQKVLWHSPQLDTNLASLLNNTSAKTITVRIPTLQEILANAPQMLSDLRAIYLVLANREIVSSSADSGRHIFPDTFCAALLGLADVSARPQRLGLPLLRLPIDVDPANRWK